MSTERGIVEKIEDDFAWVKTRRTSACNHCSSRAHCQMVGGDQMLVKAANTAQAQQGDEVELYISTRTRMKSLFMVYILPVIGLFIGAFSGSSFSELLGLNQTVGIMVFALAGLIIAFWLVRRLADQMAAKGAFTPSVKRVVRHYSKTSSN